MGDTGPSSVNFLNVFQCFRPSCLCYSVPECGLLSVVLLFVHVALSLRTAVFISPQCRGAPPPSLALSPSVLRHRVSHLLCAPLHPLFPPLLPHTCTYIHIKHTYSKASSLPLQLFLFSLILFLPHLFFFPC